MSNPSPEDIPLTPATWATTARQIAECHTMLTELKAQLDTYRPLLDAYQRGGALGLRTAVRHARKGPGS